MQEAPKRLGRIFFSKITLNPIAFIMHLLYSYFFCPCRKGSGIPRVKAFLFYFADFSVKNKSFVSKITPFFGGFLRVKSSFSSLLNTALPFQHRNKIGFLCVT